MNLKEEESVEEEEEEEKEEATPLQPIEVHVEVPVDQSLSSLW